MRSPFPTDWVAAHASRAPDARAIDGVRVRLTYGALAEHVREAAASLAHHGVTAQDRVVVALPTSPASVVAALAVHALGACAVEIDRGLGRAGLETVLAQARPRFAFVAAQDARAWSDVMGDRVFSWAWVFGAARGDAGVPAVGTSPFGEDGSLPAGERGRPTAPAPAVTADAPARVLYTSGSTGKPRGVVQTYRNIAANTRSIVAYLGLGAGDRVMAILPFHYTYGRSLLQTHLFVGGSVVVDPRFMYPRVVMEAIGTERCTSFAGVPSTYEILRREVNVREIAMPSLRYLTQAGGAMRPDTIRWVRSAFAPARLFVMYGQTEATARLSYVPPERGEEKTGSIGIAIPGVELRVVDEGAQPVPEGEVGHLVARGANVTPGYLAAPEDTASILRAGWLWTGDLARQDRDGYFWVAGRAKEMLKIGGHRVSAGEIETILLEHRGVREAAVVGVEDPVQGEAAVAFVVLSGPADGVENELRRLCRDRGGVHRVPARIRFIEAIPRNASGKVMKPELTARARAEQEGREP